MTHIYIKPLSNQRSTASREASAAGRLRPNGLTSEVGSERLDSFTEIKYDARVMSSGLQPADHEQGAIRAFVQRDKQERFLGFLANPKNRKKLTESLAHFRWFDPRFVAPIPWKVDPKGTVWERHLQAIENICRLLKSKGAGTTCWVISEDPEIDGRELDLKLALEHVNGRQIGTILSCVAGKLAYFEGEDERLLLAR